VTAKGFVEKKRVALNDFKKIALRVFFYEKEAWQPYLLKAATELMSDLHLIKGIFLDTKSLSDIKLAIVIDKASKKELKDINISIKGASRKVKFSIIDESQAKKDSANYYPIHDPLQLIGGAEEK